MATSTMSTSGWDIYAVATDTDNTIGSGHAYDIAMAWYGEVSISTLTVNWGTVKAVSDFTANVQTGITITYVCNGSYQEQVMTDNTWLHGDETVHLNAGGNPGDGQFSLKANSVSVHNILDLSEGRTKLSK